MIGKIDFSQRCAGCPVSRFGGSHDFSRAVLTMEFVQPLTIVLNARCAVQGPGFFTSRGRAAQHFAVERTRTLPYSE